MKRKGFTQATFKKGDIVAKVKTLSNYRSMNSGEFKVLEFAGSRITLEVYDEVNARLSSDFSLSEIVSIRTCF